MSKKKKTEKGFIIYHTKSLALHFTFRSTRISAIEEITHNYGCSWEELKSDGYYVQKVELVKVSKKNK